MLLDVLYILAGFLLLTGGAEMMVSGASQLARGLGVRPLVVGLTVVALGTSAPEFAVSLAASFSGEGSLAIGNVIGSNIGNIGIALGFAALIRPLVVHIRLVRFEVPILVGVSALVYLFCLNGEIPRWFGCILLAGFAVYIGLLYRWSLQERPDVVAEYARDGRRLRHPLVNSGLTAAGLASLAGGGKLLVVGASGVARAMGISELVIGLTIVAVGTSLPEVITSLVAVLRNQGDIAIGNVVGSNLFNLLGVLGAAAAARPIAIDPDLLVRDLPVMGLLTLLLFPFLRSGYVLRRWEGMLFVLIYLFYIGVIVLSQAI